MGSELTEVRMLVPGSSLDPIELEVRHSGLRMTLVDRESLHRLPAIWKTKGIYFLFGPGKSASSYHAYVGKAAVKSSTVVSRIQAHNREKDWWNRALIVVSESNGFNGSEIGYLEGRFWNVLGNAVAAEVENRNEPGDDTLTSQEEDALERFIRPVMAVLRAAGFSPDTIDQKPTETKGTKRKYYSESLKDLIDEGFLSPGTLLESFRSGVTAKALVCEDGSLEVNGKKFAAVSPAAIEASGNKSEPGWDFWGAPSGTGDLVTLASLRDKYRQSSAKAKQQEEVSNPTSGTSEDLPSKASPKGRSEVTLKMLIDSGDLKAGEILTPKVSSKASHRAKVNSDGTLDLDGERFTALSTAAKRVLGYSVAGWGAWTVERDGSPVVIDVLRKQFEADQ